jgi:hypothetical protein
VFFHPSESSDNAMPLAIANVIGEAIQPFANSLVADGWLFILPAYPGDFSVSGVNYPTNFYNDVNNDAGNGSRLYTTMGLWWDHLVGNLSNLYGANRPIFVSGFSEGAWLALNIAINRMSSIVGYISHCPATLWENTSINSPPITWTGMDLSTTALNSVTIPGNVGYSDNDASVGWALSSAENGGGLTYQGGPQSNTHLMVANAITAGQPVTAYKAASSSAGGATVAYPNGHLWLSALSPSAATLDALHYANWVSSTLDPHYPVSF